MKKVKKTNLKANEKDKYTHFLDITFWKFLLVGTINTGVGTMVMFVFYNVFKFDYWISTASNYIVGSVISYFLNKNFTFSNKTKGFNILIKFVINILLCYCIAYGVAKPVAQCFFSKYAQNIQDNMAMLIGMVCFIVVNYLGQKYFVFAKKG